MAKVIATFDKTTGECSFEVEGIPGLKCKDITELLTQGLEVVEEHDTEEALILDLPEFVESM